MARSVLTERVGRLVASVLTVLFLAALVSPPAGAYPVDPNWSPPRTVYIPETGHTIDRAFLDFWRSGGGAAAFGNPITAEITLPNKHIVQYYDYARFEYWPEGDGNGNYVVLGKIGEELGLPKLPLRLGFRASGAEQDAAREARAWLPLDLAAAEAKMRGEETYRFVPATKHGVWGGFRAFWEATGEANYLGNPVTEEYVVGGTNYQVFERGKLQWRAGQDVSLVPIGDELVARYGLPTKPEDQGDIPTYDEALFVPPAAVPAWNLAPPPPSNGRSVVVSLSQQALWAYDNGEVVRSTYVSTGKPGFETPTGLFAVNSKLPSQTMQGVIGGEYYDVPDVPDVMYFTDRGHALHGTYWHNNFGHTMSHGCVNLPMDVAEWMFDWAPIGMPVLIIN